MSSYSSPTNRSAPILLLARSLNIGGAERQILQLATGLDERGHEVVVGLFYRGGYLEQELATRGIRIVDLGKRHRWDIFGFMVRLIKALRAIQPRVVYSFLGTANTVAAAARWVSPAFKLVWSIRASNMELSKYSWASRLGYRIECLFSRHPDIIISNSLAGIEHAVKHGFPRERIVVVPNGIDTDRFRPDPALRLEMRRRWNLGEDTAVIGVLARLDPMKDHSTFLRAAAAVAAARAGIRFLCIGEGSAEYVEQLKALAQSLGIGDAVTWTGTALDPVPALNALDIACSSSSEGEGFSNAVAEAMACGRPCVVTDVGDSALLVGNTGWVVPPQNAEALSAALIDAVDSVRAVVGDRARRRIVENFSIDEMVERTIACF